MISKSEQSTYRSLLFKHLDGIVTIPTAFTLSKGGVLDLLHTKKEISIAEIATICSANEGYLNVALRVLCSQGWLTQKMEQKEVFYSLNHRSELAFSYITLLQPIVELMQYGAQFHPRKFEKQPFDLLEKLFESYKKLKEEPLPILPLEQEIKQQVLLHMEGAITGPSIVQLAMSGMFHKYFMQASFRAEEFHKDGQSFETLLDFFTYLNWFNKKNGTYQFTDKGLFFAKRASAYGVTVSYIPTLRNLDTLVFGNPEALSSSLGQTEAHVDREMNVWGSGGAHAAYFKKVDDIIIEVFNKPIAEQPLGVLDMGCGNGAFLEHIFDVIEHRTLRGKMLDEYPLILVGADYNQAALNVARANLISADIWAKIVWGDIGQPDLLAKNLKEDYHIDLQNLLNVRTFLDHNRPWNEPIRANKNESKSTGAFAFKGKRLQNKEVEQSLCEHFEKWKPYIQKFGLLVIELHTLDPGLTAQNLGKTPATAYDATHGFSDQYILEIPVFLSVAKKAGLQSVQKFAATFPKNELATVSINLFKGAE